MTRIKCVYEQRAHVLGFLIILLHDMTGAALSCGAVSSPALLITTTAVTKSVSVAQLARAHPRPAHLAFHLPFKACVFLTSIPPRRKKNISLWQTREAH